MGRIHDAYQQREVHLGVVGTLMLVTNCRYIATNQPDAVCAILPLVFQCIGAVMLLVSARCSDSMSNAVRACQPLIVLGALVCTVLSVVHIYHLLQCTVSILNAYVLASLSTELWIFHQENVVSS